MNFFPLFLSIAFCVAASFFDLRERRIPNFLNAAGALLAVFFAVANGVALTDFFLIAAASFLFAYVLYRIGAWAGGDAKFFTVLCALLASTTPNFLLIPALFLLSALLTAPVALIYVKPTRLLRGVALQLWQKKFPLATSALLSAAFFAFSPYVGAVAVVLLALLSLAVEIPLPLALLLFLAAAFLSGEAVFAWLLYAFFATVAASALFLCLSLLRKQLSHKIPVSSLKEGDVPCSSFYIARGKLVEWAAPSPMQLVRALLARKRVSPPAGIPVASCFSSRGITAPQANALKKAGLKHLFVRQTIAFAPALGAAFVLLALGGLPWLLALKLA